MTTRRNTHSLACKRLLRLSIAQSGLQQKAVAIDCRVDQGTFSRYLSQEHEHQLPVDLIPAFVASTGDDRIVRHLAEMCGLVVIPANEKAPRERGQSRKR